ncbi:thioredoxin [Persicobacter diffluens]|uniref:Thioredoxin n=2 Tax=Persicobacter diffluens TaxID=981 RepID=A0AAN4VX93_9BACT|nr:thioredoxin [Persicobacter diffluens]
MLLFLTGSFLHPQTMKPSHSNRLIDSTSPYLLQHAHNPVNWYPWGPEALNRATNENKPILVSIGYSACHWCHVMERESFENDAIAEIMNEYFICIKVDREERPDVDQLYMDAVQAMGKQGGWPLNVFLTPEQQPFFGGTYFPPQQWEHLLEKIHQAWFEKQAEINQSANRLAERLGLSDIDKFGLKPGEDPEDIRQWIDQLAQDILSEVDWEKGGMNRAPKFPMPVIWDFLLDYSLLQKNQQATKAVKLVLNQMAYGGIYDQLGGGFSRYSVDADWFAPHFEKMLYDNAQLLSLYSKAYRTEGNEEYKRIITETLNWLEREMKSPEGGYYAALDADSEGVEGLFYTWSAAELKSLLGNQYAVFAQYYQIEEHGNFEGRNILFPQKSIKVFEETVPNASAIIENCHQKLWEIRNERSRPATDDKILAAWNGLLLKGLADAWLVSQKPEDKDNAIALGAFISGKMIKEDGSLWRSFKNGHGSIEAFLEDYAAVIEGFIHLYQITFNEKWLLQSEQLTKYVLQNFAQKDSPYLNFTNILHHDLIVQKAEFFDNVIPASNSIMAFNLYYLGTALDRPDWTKRAWEMLSYTRKIADQNAQYIANWSRLWLFKLHPSPEIICLGEQALQHGIQWQLDYLPNQIIQASIHNSTLPLFYGKTLKNEQSTIFVCLNNQCQSPANELKQAKSQLKSLIP